MPCDSVRLCQLDLKCAHPEIMCAALKRLGWRIQTATDAQLVAYTPQGQRFVVDYKAGQATVARGDEHIVDTAKREYGFELGRVAAKRFNWNFRKTGQNSFVISRRY